ncbi:MAG TPA: DUF2267 domain-containing protein [Thermoanaerobaculia bacterium]|nr:DUF2267 domain-containing protein [Thermoanaerobaculia bacterium]
MSLDDFFRRVCSREGEGADFPESVYHVRAVMEVLSEASTAGIIDKVGSTLPAEFRPICEAGSQGNMDVNRNQTARHA